MKFLILFLISFNLWASTPLYKITDSIKTSCLCKKATKDGVIIKIWTGDSPMYLVEFADGMQIPLDENELTLNP